MSVDTERKLRLAVGHLFRIFHNTTVSTARYEIAMKLADFPGYAWCPEDKNPYVLLIEEVTHQRVFLRTPDSNEEAIAMSVAQPKSTWNPPREKL